MKYMLAITLSLALPAHAMNNNNLTQPKRLNEQEQKELQASLHMIEASSNLNHEEKVALAENFNFATFLVSQIAASLEAQREAKKKENQQFSFFHPEDVDLQDDLDAADNKKTSIHIKKNIETILKESLEN